MIIRFLSHAKSELTDAVAYYEGELSGLVIHFAWIERNHEVLRQRPGGYRRVNLKIFPYYVSYVVREQVIWILAVAHAHSLPEYWIDRPKDID